MPSIGTTMRRPASTSALTARRLSTAGPSPDSTAALIAVVEPSSTAGVTASPRRCKDRSSTSRVPDPISRKTSGVSASSCADTRRPPFAHACKGSTTTRSSSSSTTWLRSPARVECPSTNRARSSIPDQVDHVFGVAISNDTRMSRSVVLSRMSTGAPGTHDRHRRGHMELALGLRPQGRRTLEESPHVFDNPSRPLDYGAPIRRQLRPTGGPVEEIESDCSLEVEVGCSQPAA